MVKNKAALLLILQKWVTECIGLCKCDTTNAPMYWEFIIADKSGVSDKI